MRSALEPRWFWDRRRPRWSRSETPKRKKFEYVHLTSRVEDRPLPEVEIVNMREEYAAEGKQVIFSRRLLQAIGERLERREQTMVLLNRRGFAAFLLCRHCGFTFQCSSCSVSMTYHRSIDRLLCHYCGLAKRPPKQCPECRSEYIHYVGEGTERIESDLREFFGDARIGRIDRDTMKHIRDFERVLGGFRKGEIDILVGTQMIAKGHDFPLVTLVGVLAADAALSLPDFRAAERTFQLLTQVAGTIRSRRSSRGSDHSKFFPGPLHVSAGMHPAVRRVLRARIQISESDVLSAVYGACRNRGHGPRQGTCCPGVPRHRRISGRLFAETPCGSLVPRLPRSNG